MGSYTGTEVLQVESELAWMIAVYRDHKPRRVLEIGTWDGGTLKGWLTEFVPDLVVAVDLDHDERVRYDGWRNPFTKLEVITGDSRDPVTISRIQHFAPYDWVFIDGDHGHLGVRTDLATCLPLVAPGGLLAFHDIVSAEGTEYPPGAVVRELVAAGYKAFSFVDPEPSDVAHGVGIVRC